eukprot:TRINITY_DN5996_c0_g1_i1.p1 TRINITY_DN5996_c0_g1~~TRINITY_DN5996_c0_g1_i1.p1  ORF type:complete len:381 (+),score=61.53 TRINITY_DN5996_c0_g1_i1:45-1187(+)
MMLITDSISVEKVRRRNDRIVLCAISKVLKEVGFQTIDEMLSGLDLEETVFVKGGCYFINSMDLKLRLMTQFPNYIERVQRTLFEVNDINLQKLRQFMNKEHREVRCFFATLSGQTLHLRLHTSQTPSTHESVLSKIRKHLSMPPSDSKVIQIKDGHGNDVCLNDESNWVEAERYFVVVSDRVEQSTQTPPRERRRHKKRPDGVIEEILFAERSVGIVASPGVEKSKSSKEGEVRSVIAIPEKVRKVKKKEKKKKEKAEKKEMVTFPNYSPPSSPHPPEQPAGVVRMVQHLQLDVKLGEPIGMRINVTRIEGVSKRGPAARAGFTPGMIIRAVNNISVYSFREIEDALFIFEGPHIITVTSFQGDSSYGTPSPRSQSQSR